jgi:acyl-coenzyme A synthetase/AMP-(fatty) acid ligase
MFDAARQAVRLFRAPMHVVDMIFFWAKARPHHPAIIQSEVVITYKGLADAIRLVCEQISRLNLEPDEPVAVSIESPAYQLLVTFALLRSGFAAAPVYQNRLPFLRPSGIKNIIYAEQGLLLSGGRNIRFENSWLANANAPNVAVAGDHQRTTDYPNLIFFGPGTAGPPTTYTSAALLEHLSTTATRENDEISRLLILTSTTSSFGFNCACEMFYGGKTACFSRPDVSSLVLISTYQIEGIFASSQQLRGLGKLSSNRDSARYPLDSLKSLRIAVGDPVSRDFVSFAKTLFCPKVTIVYGSSKAGVLTSADADTIIHTPGSVGYALPWVELEIVDEAGNVLPAGKIGRIRCRTPVFLKNLAANDPAMPNGESNAWCYLAVLGSVTADGLLCIAGRAADVIDQVGHKVSAFALEETLRSCAGVQDAGVCGVIGNSGAVELWIAIVSKPSLTLSELKREIDAAEKFGAQIDKLVIVDAIPRTGQGSVKRNELQQKLLSSETPPSRLAGLS